MFCLSQALVIDVYNDVTKWTVEGIKAEHKKWWNESCDMIYKREVVVDWAEGKPLFSRFSLL